MNIGIIGFGAIGQTLCRLIEEHARAVRVAAIVELPALHAGLRAGLPATARLVATAQEILSSEIDLVVECAGHAALKTVGPQVLRAGIDLLIASVGALADAEIETALRSAASASGAKLRIPAGALGGLDVLGAAKLAGLDSVVYASTKAPRAWKGTPAEGLAALDAMTEAAVFYTGSARDAALLFPQNANVAAAVALAGLGFERTRVELTADPAATGNHHRIHAVGAFGEIDVSIVSKTLPENPKTSMLAPYSLVRALANLSEALVVG